MAGGRVLATSPPKQTTRQLVEIGALTPADKRGRNRIWQSNDVLAALGDFAARASHTT